MSVQARVLLVSRGPDRDGTVWPVEQIHEMLERKILQREVPVTLPDGTAGGWLVTVSLEDDGVYGVVEVPDGLLDPLDDAHHLRGSVEGKVRSFSIDTEAIRTVDIEDVTQIRLVPLPHVVVSRAGEPLLERAQAVMGGLANVLEAVEALRDELGRGSPGRHVAVAVTQLQTAGLWLTVAEGELRGGFMADQIILDGLRGI